MKKQFFFFSLLFLLTLSSFAQVYKNPIAAKLSHPELKITQIKITDAETIISLKITNKRDDGGWFCANEDIYIKNSNGIEKFQLMRSENIPTCPDQHEFAIAGGTLEFKLYFPKIPADIMFIDLVEDCNNACFYFTGIILNNEHNNNIVSFEKGFDLYQNKEFIEAIPYFEKIIRAKIPIQSQIYGLSYYYLINIYHESGNTEKVNMLYDKLKTSDLDDKETFIKELKRLEIIK
jgi:tetratricopeptide (TPR) repeat protein